MEHQTECDLLLAPLDPYEELLANGMVAIDESPRELERLEQQARRDGGPWP